MVEKQKIPAGTQPVVTIPGLGQVPVVAVKLPDGRLALRHPSELRKISPPPAERGGEK